MLDIRTGDCIEVLRTFPENHFDACVTDPPYAIGFMGKKWDLMDIRKAASRRRKYGAYGSRAASGRTSTGFEGASSVAETYDIPGKGLKAFQHWCQEWGLELLRVMKPGAHVLVFGMPRTSHRLVCGLEDAGFEIRDVLMWLFGSGFPKSLDVSKAIDKELGATRSTIGRRTGRAANPKSMGITGGRYGSTHDDRDVSAITAPATVEATRWSGWGTALKPAYEPIILARKPLGGPVVGNILKFGTGGLNVDTARIPGEKGSGNWAGATEMRGYDGGWDATRKPNIEENPLGRWPANVILDEESAAVLNESVGTLRSGAGTFRRNVGIGYKGGTFPDTTVRMTYGDSGGPSRFFYCAKASRDERERGLRTLRNTHPTVKPIDLIRYLVKLITPPGGTVLDPFSGSGTTLVAAGLGGFSAVGIEKEAEYVEIARARIRGWLPLETTSEPRTETT